MTLLIRASLLVCLSVGFMPTARAATRVSGIVVDPTGRPVPRARVRSLTPSGDVVATTFSGDDGRFQVDRAADGCRLDASLSGFNPATARCDVPGPIRLVLTIAPVREAVVVTATRTEAPADQVGASVTTFTADDLARRNRPPVSELLRTSPGVMIVQSGAPGGVTSLFVRGGESNYNKVLLDGIPLNEPGGAFDFSDVTTEGLERVEIVRGAQSALFGSDAMASVVQLFSTRAAGSSGPPRASVQLDGGTYGTFHTSASISGTAGALDYALGAARLSSDNLVPNSGVRDTTLSADVGLALGGDTTLRLVARSQQEHAGTPGQTAFGRPDLDAFFGRHDSVAGVTLDTRVRPSVRQRFTYSFAASNQVSTNLHLDAPYTPSFGTSAAPFAFFDFTYDSGTILHRHHASYQADWVLTNDGRRGQQTLTVVADWDGERAVLEDRLAGTRSTASRNNFGWSVEQQMLWPRVSVTIGGRLEYNDSFGVAAVPRASVVYAVHLSKGVLGDTRVKASAGLGIKEPTLLQSFSTSPFFLGNPALEPERSRTLDVGVEQRLLTDRAKIEATWFDNRYRNIISTRTISFDPFESQYFNIGATRARGLEIAIDTAPLNSLQIRGGYTFLDSRILESTLPGDPVFAPGQWAFRRPRHAGFLDAGWRRGPVTADVNATFVGRYADSDFSSLVPPLVENPGYNVWNVRVSVRVTRQLAGIVSVDNLTDRSYMEPLGYQALGRAVRVGVRVAF